MPSAGEEDRLSVTGTLKHVKSSVAPSGGIVLRWSSGYGAGGQFLRPGVRSPVATHFLTSLNRPVSSLAPDSNWISVTQALVSATSDLEAICARTEWKIYLVPL